MLLPPVSNANTSALMGDPEIWNQETGDTENRELLNSIGPPFLLEETPLPT